MYGTVSQANRRSAIDTELPALALIAGRVAVAVRRTIESSPLDSQDRRDIRTARDDLLKSSESTVLGRRLPDRHLRSRRLIVSTARETSGKADNSALNSKLSSLAADLDRILAGKRPRDPAALVQYYEHLASSARKQSRGRAETVVRVP
jgi:hypothetical protein